MSCQIIDLSIELGREYVVNRYHNRLAIPTPPSRRNLTQMLQINGAMSEPFRIKRISTRRSWVERLMDRMFK